MTFLQKLEAEWNTDIEPWFEHLFKSAVAAEVTALMPIVSAAAGAEAANLATNSSNLSAFAATTSKILADAATKAEAASIQAGGMSLLTAVNTAIATHAQAVPLGGQPIPPLPVQTGSGTNVTQG